MPVPPPTPGVSSIALALALAGCVPEGPPSERAIDETALGEVDPPPARPRTVDARPLDPLLEEPFEDDFERDEIGPSWRALSPAWHLADGRLCVSGAKNQGIWLRRRIPAAARIRFDARSDHPDGDIKLELWGDGISGASKASYDDASGYVLVFGGWQNRLHVLARRDEHDDERLVARVRERGEALRDRAVEPGRTYRFEIDRVDGETLVWRVDGEVIHELADAEPLQGPGHDHLGFNDWTTPVCFDNLRVEPL